MRHTIEDVYRILQLRGHSTHVDRLPIIEAAPERAHIAFEYAMHGHEAAVSVVIHHLDGASLCVLADRTDKGTHVEGAFIDGPWVDAIDHGLDVIEARDSEIKAQAVAAEREKEEREAAEKAALYDKMRALFPAPPTTALPRSPAAAGNKDGKKRDGGPAWRPGKRLMPT